MSVEPQVKVIVEKYSMTCMATFDHQVIKSIDVINLSQVGFQSKRGFMLFCLKLFSLLFLSSQLRQNLKGPYSSAGSDECETFKVSNNIEYIPHMQLINDINIMTKAKVNWKF